MPKVDITITISVVIAVCAIISPIITTLLNNRHLYKMKKLDMKLEAEKSSHFYKRGIYEEYLKLAGKCVANANDDSMQEYGEIYLLALVYFPEELRPELTRINTLICSYSWKAARPALDELAPKICTILQTL